MLNLLLYSDTNELVHRYEFLIKNQSTEIVAPSPRMADEIRAFLQNYFPRVQFNVVTFAFFLKKIMLQLNVEDKLLRKSHWLISLANHWGNSFSMDSKEDEGNIFLKCYELVTELRSFTLDFSLIEEVLGELLEETKQGVAFLWKAIDKSDYFDEFKSYSWLTQNIHQLKNAEKKEAKKNYLFWGIDFFSGLQIDFFKALSEVHDVSFFFPREVYKKSNPTDWVQWINTERTLEEDGDYEGENSSFDQILTIHQFKKGPKNDLLQKFETIREVYLGSSDQSIENILSLGLQENQFIVPANLFHSLNLSIYNFFQQNIPKRGLDQVRTLQLLDDLIKKSIELDQARKLKIYLIWRQYISLIKFINHFHLKILFEAVELDLPRLNARPLSLNLDKKRIYDFQLISKIFNEERKILFLSSEFSAPTFNQILSPQMMSLLSPIGPVKRKELTLMIQQHAISNLIKKDKLILLAEEKIIDEVPYWSQLFEIFSKNYQKLEVISIKREIRNDFDYQNQKERKDFLQGMVLSATKLQTYLDCPRKFFHRYFLNLKARPKLLHTINALEKGRIFHKLVGDYLKKFQVWDELAFHQLTFFVLTNFLNNEEKLMSSLEFQTLHFELKFKTEKMIKLIIDIRNSFDVKKIDFEKIMTSNILEKYRTEGIIDALITTSFGVGVIDFKQSDYGIPSEKDLFSFKEVQILFYLTLIKQSPIHFFGYLNFDQLSNSLIFSSDEIFINHLLKKWNIKVRKIGEDFENQMNNFLKSINITIEQIEAHCFPIRPLSQEKCRYCDYQKVCPKVEPEIKLAKL